MFEQLLYQTGSLVSHFMVFEKVLLYSDSLSSSSHLLLEKLL